MSKEKQSEGYNTKSRRAAIKSLIAEKIGTQKELSDRLYEMGFRATQATISRDIRELHLIKVSDSRGKYYTFPETHDELIATDQFMNMYRSLVQKVSRVNNLIVLRTNSGMANALCATMDRMDWPGVLGTIAGDDTVLLIAGDEVIAKDIAERLSAL